MTPIKAPDASCIAEDPNCPHGLERIERAYPYSVFVKQTPRYFSFTILFNLAEIDVS